MYRVAERKTASEVEAGKLADDYLQVCRHIHQGNLKNRKERSSSGIDDPRKCHKCGSKGHLKRNCPVKEEAARTGNPHKGA